MRRLAIAVAMLGTCLSSRALADPFERLSSRVVQYEQQLDGSAPRAQPEPEPVPSPTPDPGVDGGYYPQDGMWAEPMMAEYGGGWDDCSAGSCGSCCGIPPGFWGRAEFLLWWVRGADTPPLVTTSPDGTPIGTAGILPNATVLFGGNEINTDVRPGGRFTLGYFCDPCQTLGIEDTFFFLGGSDDGFSASSSGSPILARPFFNTQTDAQDAVLLAYPQVVLGTVNITSGQTIASNEINLRRALYIDCCRRIDILAGYRYFYLSEGLNIATNTTSIDGEVVPIGTTFGIQDAFDTRNHYNGGQLGVNLQYYRGCWTFDLLFKLALGGVSQRVKINGSTVVTVPNEDPVVNQGGVLALDSNIGSYNRTQFGVMPELGLNARYQWSPLWTLSFGYTLIGLSNVVRPGDQIDLRLDPNQFPPPVSQGTFPQFSFNQTDLWLQGLNFGIECNF